MGRWKEDTRECFAAIPVKVMSSAAYRTLPVGHRDVLWTLCSTYRGNNNGNLSLTRRQAENLGLKSERRRTHGLRELESRGLILRARQGGLRPLRPTLWALSWRQIDYWNGKESPRPPPNTWRRFKIEHRSQSGGSTANSAVVGKAC